MIKIITVGKIKEKYFIDAIKEYEKRLKKYTKISIIEVNDESYDIKKTLEIEKENIMKHINTKGYIIALDIEGKEIDSVSFSKKIEDVQNHYSDIYFIIGGSYGLSDEIKTISNFSLSFSKMTFPHKLFRIMFLEQLYRAYKIINNETYHK